MYKTISVDVDVNVDDVLDELGEKDWADLGYQKVEKMDAGPVRAHIDAMRLAARRRELGKFLHEAEKVADSVGVILDASPLLASVST